MSESDTKAMSEAELVPYWKQRALEAEKRETALMVRHAKLKDALIQLHNLPVHWIVENALRGD